MYAKNILGGVCLLAFSSVYAQQQPNVIYIFPDQFRNSAMSFWNESEFQDHINFKADPVHTPNLNKFAKESCVLSSAVSNFPLSSPHRGMLLTGMYPDGSGVTLNCNSNRPISTLRPEATTISDVFRHTGYECAYIGKLHADFPTPNDPENPGQYVESKRPVWDAYTPPEKRHGFNYWYSYGTFDVHKEPHYWDTQGRRHEIKEWSPKHEADKVISYLKNDANVRDAEKPFFIMLSMNPPHGPYSSLEDCMQEDYNLYKDTPLNELLVRPNANIEMAKAQNVRCYFASITGVDREFGRILTTLEELGLDKNTIVIFASDHGETMCSQNTTDPKNSPYSESLNIPFIVRYPEKIEPRVDNLLLSSPDIMPTILGLCNLQDQIPKSVQGHDYSSLFFDSTATITRPKSAIYIQNVDGEKDSQGILQSYFPISRGIKTEQYTLALYIDRKTKRLQKTLFFDDRADPYQLNNLDINENSILFRSLCKQMANLFEETDDIWYRDRVLSDLIPYN